MLCTRTFATASSGFGCVCRGCVMVRRLRGFAATGCRQAFFLVLGAGLMWANFVTPAASEGYYDVTITKSELDCEGTCTIADMPKVFAQACQVAGGTLL